MPQEFDEIISELEKLDKEGSALGYAYSSVDPKDYRHESISLALDVANRVRDAVASDSWQWYCVGAHGDKLRIGDKVRKRFGGGGGEVTGFTLHDVLYGDGECALPDDLIRMDIDSQEKIERDYRKLRAEAETNVLTSGVFGGFEVRDLLDCFGALLDRQRKLDSGGSCFLESSKGCAVTVEKSFVSYGYQCLVLGNGYMCGYVGIPESHPFYGKDYTEIEELDGCPCVHGGLTFSSGMNPATFDEDGLWWLGFDCNHAGDYAPYKPFHLPDEHEWTVDEVVRETSELAKQLMQLEAKITLD